MKSRETTGRQDPKSRILSILQGFVWKTKKILKKLVNLESKENIM